MIKVLVVDDDHDARDFVGQMLEKEGYEVIKAASGAEALDKVKAHNPHIILLDIYMPQMDGFQALKNIRSISKDAVVMMMTSSLDIDIAQRAIKAGAVNYLLKPIDANLLKNSVLGWAMEIEAKQFKDVNILVVEYDEKKIKTVIELFTKKGHKVKAVENKEDESVIGNAELDLLVVRADLLGDKAVKVVEKYKEFYPESPVIITAADPKSSADLAVKTASYGRSRQLPNYFDSFGFVIVVQHIMVESKYGRKSNSPAGTAEYIFVVDDEPEICRYVEDFLVERGYKVWSTTDPKSVLKKVEALRPSIVLLDIVMPSINGMELLKNIRKISPQTHVIMATAVKDEAICRECIEAGASDYIIKPFSMEQLKTTIFTNSVKSHLAR